MYLARSARRADPVLADSPFSSSIDSAPSCYWQKWSLLLLCASTSGCIVPA